jgi:hypothetical protein
VGIICFDIHPFHDKGPHHLLWACSRVASRKITVSGIPSRLNYFEIFIVYIKFTNVAAARIIQPGGPRSGLVAHALLVPAQIISNHYCPNKLKGKSRSAVLRRKIWHLKYLTAMKIMLSSIYLKNKNTFFLASVFKEITQVSKTTAKHDLNSE